MFDGLLGNNSLEVLLNPTMQEQFGHIMVAGNCDAKLEEIDWPTVVKQWDLPIPKKRIK